MNKTELKTVLILIILTGIGCVTRLPWWLFLLPIFIFGVLTTILNWNIRGFLTGFIAGFSVWFLGNLYYHLHYNGIILKRTADVVSIPLVTLLVFMGLIGGVLAGLAFYTGRQILKK